MPFYIKVIAYKKNSRFFCVWLEHIQNKKYNTFKFSAVLVGKAAKASVYVYFTV